MSRFSKRAFVVVVAGLLTAIGLLSASADRAHRPVQGDITEPFFRKLETVRADRKVQVVAYFEAARRLAEGILEDSAMMDAFQDLRGRDGSLNPRDDLELDVHYVNRYGEFYDILFVDRSGYVFHSVRRESDYHSNLFDGPLADTKLAQRLRTATEIAFIDYEPYPPSDEPAAFFAVPVFDPGRADADTAGGEPVGWFILQCPLNKLNSILSDRRRLGRTGEVYLVNTEQRMVTESRFRRDPANLQLKVDTLAVSSALASGSGERVIRDYRGVRVLSSFERFELFGTTWVIIAEIDEAEAITEHYKCHREFYLQELGRFLKDTPVQTTPSFTVDEYIRRVDTNEFARAEAGAALRTSGVSTCTAITAVLPGRFGYLAHIGPSDRIYGKPDMGHNDCLGEMLHRLQRYDVYPYELPELEFTIIAVHRESFAAAIDRLLDLGVELAQIRFAYNRKAQYANVLLAPEESSVLIEWIESSGQTTPSLSSDFDDLRSIVKRLVATTR